MNSKTIQAENPQIYEDFFARCEVACSAPLILNWGTEYSTINGGLGINQKLPLRIYAGVEKNIASTDKDLINFQIYLPEKKKFVKYYFEDEQNDRMVRALKYLGLLEKNYKINIISEYHHARGIQAYGPFAVVVISALLLFNQKIKPEELNEYKKFTNKQLFKTGQSTDPVIKLIDAFYTFMPALSGFINSNLGIYTSFFDGSELFLFHQQPIDYKFIYEKGLQVEEIAEYINKLNYAIVSFNKILNFDFHEIPFDYIILFNGLDRKYGDIFHPLSKIIADLDKTREILATTKKFIFPKDINNPFLAKALKSDKLELLNYYRKGASLLTIEIFKNFYLLLKEKNISTYDFLVDFKRCANIFEIFKEVNPSIISLFNTIDNWGEGKTFVNVCAKPLYLNDALVIGEKMSFRLEIEGFENYLQEEGYNIKTFYKSWEDGLEIEGLKIEQFLEKNITSALYLKKYATATEYKNNKVTKLKYSYEDLQKFLEKTDILLDRTENKIYFKGRLLSSKEIKSAKKTILLLSALLEKKTIRPEQIDLNSYSDRNELQSKILSPLEKAAKKYLNHKLSLVTTGGLANNYTITFEPKDLKIIIIED